MRWIVVLLVWSDPNPVPQVTAGTTYHHSQVACNKQAVKVIMEAVLLPKDTARVRCELLTR